MTVVQSYLVISTKYKYMLNLWQILLLHHTWQEKQMPVHQKYVHKNIHNLIHSNKISVNKEID